MIKYLLKSALLLPFLLLPCCVLLAQERTVTGKVTDADGKPLQGVTVGIKGTNTNTATDVNGDFSIKVPSAQSVIKFTNVGLLYQELTVGAKTALSITLQKDNKQLDDVVVIGYGTQKTRNVTGSIVSVDMKKLEDLPVASVSEMLRVSFN